MKTSKNTDFITLWRGMIKMCQWKFQTEEVATLFEKYFEEDEKANTTLSFMYAKSSEKMTEILLEILEQFKWRISNNYTGEKYSKKSAREYVLEYKE